MVTFKDAMKVSDHRRGTLKAIDIMIPKTNLIIMNPNRTADDVLIQMTRKQMARVFVCNEEGRLIGLASKTDIMNAASERKEYMKAVKKFAENK
jgi:CBS domain-containing protein